MRAPTAIRILYVCLLIIGLAIILHILLLYINKPISTPLASASLALFIGTLLLTIDLAYRNIKAARQARDELRRVKTRSEEVERQLVSVEHDYKNIFEKNPMPMWIFDLESLRFLTVNHAAIENYGYTQDEFLAMTIQNLRDREESERLQMFMSGQRSALNSAGIWKHRKKDGTIIDVEIVSHELLWEGKKARLVMAADVTERACAQKKILELNQTLEKKVEERTAQLEAINRELETFSYSVSHDLRAPLRGIDGFSQAVMEDYAQLLDEKGKRYLSRIRSATQRMGHLIDDLLSLSKISKSAVHRTQVDASEIAEELVTELREKSPSRTITVKIEQGLQMYADPGLLKIVLQNLLENAWKFTSKTESPVVTIKKVAMNGQDVLAVSDNGAGFDMQYAHKLFGAFQRLHAATEYEGTGIGLATVQRIIHMHGGKIWAEGSVGQGATFYFSVGEDHEHKSNSAG